MILSLGDWKDDTWIGTANMEVGILEKGEGLSSVLDV